MFVIRITPCATSPTTFLTRTNFVTATQPHQLSHSGTHSIGIKPTASVDPNATTVALRVLSDRTIVAAIVGTVSWLLPGSHVAASALQRSSLAESFALRCKAISSSETEDAGPLIMSDPLDNPFQVSIGVTGMSPSLNFAMGGLIANIAVCLVWGVAKTIAVFIYGTFYDRTPPSVSLGEVILATFDAYTPLLTACSSGAVAALALHSQSGDLVLGCIMVTVWCAPFIIIVAKLGVQYRGPHFPFDAVLFSPGPDSPSATFRIRWFGERHELVTCPRSRLGSVTLAARDLLGEYRVGRHCFICFELAVSITTGFLVGLGWFSQNCSTYLSAVAAVSVFSTLMALTFPLQVTAENFKRLLLEMISASVALLSAMELDSQSDSLMYFQVALTVALAWCRPFTLATRRRQRTIEIAQRHFTSQFANSTHKTATLHKKKTTTSYFSHQDDVKCQNILQQLRNLQEMDPKSVRIHPSDWHLIKIAFYANVSKRNGTTTFPPPIHSAEVLTILVHAAALQREISQQPQLH